MSGTGGGNALAHTHGTGEAHRSDAGVVDQGVANDAARAHDEVEHTGRDAAAVDDVGQRPGTAWHQVCRFQHHAVAIGQCRCNLPGGDGDREVPGGDEADHAQRLAGDFHPDAGAHGGQCFTGQAQAFTGKELEDVAGTGSFANAFGACLALFAGEQGAQLFFASQDFIPDFVERVGAGLDATCRPSRKGLLGSGYRGVELGHIGLGVFTDHVCEVGRIQVGRVAGAGEPFAVDQVVVLGGHSVMKWVKRRSRRRCGGWNE